MLCGPLHTRDGDGFCEACGEPFPCPTGIAVYESVVGSVIDSVIGHAEPTVERDQILVPLSRTELARLANLTQQSDDAELNDRLQRILRQVLG
jgi:hypothetical protein